MEKKILMDVINLILTEVIEGNKFVQWLKQRRIDCESFSKRKIKYSTSIL